MLTRQDKSRRGPRSPFGRSGLWSGLSTTALLVILAGVGVGIAFGMGPLEQRAAQVIGARPPTVTIAWPPLEVPKDAPPEERAAAASKTWLVEQFQEELLARAARALAMEPISTSPGTFDRRALAAVGEAMRTSGWFSGTPTVTRRSDGVIHVEGGWRIAAAVVRHDGRDRLISWEAMPMPVEYAPGRSGLVVIQGVGGAPARQGRAIDFLAAWPGEDLRAGLELLAILARQPWARQVTAIDVGSFQRTRQLEIRTAAGGRVVWGGRPSAPLPGEGSTAAKLGWLDYLARERGSIDAGLKAVDVSGTQPLEIDVSASGGRP